MNKAILQEEVQDFINKNLHNDAAKIALSKSPFSTISSAELAAQIVAKKKAEKKLPTWFNTDGIYYPPALSIEQTSSEIAAKHKATIVSGDTLLDATGGFGIDAYYFAQTNKKVVHCEIIKELSEIAAHNSIALGAANIEFLNTDGIEFAKQNNIPWDTIYVDPARRGNTGKVFKLSDCTPNVQENLPQLLAKTNRLLLKTSPLLDIDAGLKELTHVKEINVVSIKNECKELLWIIEPNYTGDLKITTSTLNNNIKTFSFYKNDLIARATFTENVYEGLFLYEPDVAILKASIQDAIALRYELQKLHSNTQLYTSTKQETEFPGRIFQIQGVMDTKEIKKSKGLIGNVIVRNYPAKAEELARKYAIKPSKDQFIIFCKMADEKNIAVLAKILQHY